MKYEIIRQSLQKNPKTWLVTGAAGFIGSNLVETLIGLGQCVVGLDNLSTGHMSNIQQIKDKVNREQWNNFQFIEGDILDEAVCAKATMNVNYVLHQAALGSVPRSLEDPSKTNAVNVTGFLNILLAAKEASVETFVYAASSSTYGDHPDLPKCEDIIGKPLSPYAVTKYVNELYADVFHKAYGVNSVGLRYFNVFGPRQDPDGAYAAVIPKWIDKILQNEPLIVNGDGTTSRDFCYIENVIQANILAACCDNKHKNTVYNVAVGEQTSLMQLIQYLKTELSDLDQQHEINVIHSDFRDGDIQHSLASIHKIKVSLGYQPSHSILDGIRTSLPWYISRFRKY